MRISLLASLSLCSCAVMSATQVQAPSPQLTNELAATQARLRAAQEAAEAHCAPLQSRQVSWEEERTIGAELAVNFTAQLGHLYLEGLTEKNPQALLHTLAEKKPLSLPEGGKNAVSAHVAIVGRLLARYSSRPDLPWVFGVIESDAARAFSTPGGFVFVTTGLLKKMSNEAQLAGVLSHEIAHVVQKHGLAKYVDAKHQQCLAANTAAAMIERGVPANAEAARYARHFADELDLGKADGGFMKFLMNMTLMLALSGNDAEQEFHADKLALELVSFAGYDAVQYEQFLTTWAQDKHPPSAARALKLEALRNGELKDFAQGTAKPELGKVFAPLSAP